MPVATKIEPRGFHLSGLAIDVLDLMLNVPDYDYAFFEEILAFKELSKVDPDDICDTVNELSKRKFLRLIEKPYGTVYAVNKLRISNMMFEYGLELGADMPR